MIKCLALLVALATALPCPVPVDQLWARIEPFAPITAAVLDGAIAECKAQDRCLPSTFSSKGAALIAVCDANRNGVLEADEFQSCAPITTKPRMMHLCKVLDCYTSAVKNNVLSSPASISNGDDFCCERFASYPTYCTNTVPCTGSHYPISVNPVFVNVLIATIVFCITGVTQAIMNRRFVKYGVMKGD